MKIYATGDLPSYFKINGEYAGVIDKNLREFEVSQSEALFELLPKSCTYLPCYGDRFGSDTLKVFNVEDGLLIYPVFKRCFGGAFKLLGQTSTNVNGLELTLSVTAEGGFARFYLDGAFHEVKPLPFTPEKFELYCDKGLVFASFSLEKTALFVYSSQNGNLLFNGVVDAFSLGEFLTTRRTFNAVIKTTVIERWSFNDLATLVDRRDEKERSFYELNPSLIATAFFESVVIGASVGEICTPALLKRYDELRGFLGKIIRVIPSPIKNGEAWLVTEHSVLKGVLEYQNGLINNVLLDDF